MHILHVHIHSTEEIHERLFVSSQILSENLELFIGSKSQDLQQMAMWLVIQLHYSGE